MLGAGFFRQGFVWWAEDHCPGWASREPGSVYRTLPEQTLSCRGRAELALGGGGW